MTAATQLAVIYVTKSRILRRKIVPDSDSELRLHQPGPGESRLLLPLPHRYDDAACRAAIASATGVIPPSGRCCIVDARGIVIGVCKADPELDVHPAGQLVAHDAAAPGDRHENGEFKRQYAVIDRTSNRVMAIVHLPLDNAAAPDGSFLVNAGDHKIGEIVPRKAVGPASS